MDITFNVGAVAAIIALATTVLGLIATCVRFFDGQKQKLKKLEEDDKFLKRGMFAVLDGLHQQGCNGEVTKAWNEFREHIIDN